MAESLEQMARRLGLALSARNWYVTTAESCTGGWIAQILTSIPGSSAWFDRGVVAYSNQAKRDMLEVRAETLQTHGAVSRATVAEMVSGALRAAGADAAVAVTGIAGPDGGTADRPVGTVWLGWMLRDGAPVVRVERFGGDRQAVREQTVRSALDGLLRLAES